MRGWRDGEPDMASEAGCRLGAGARFPRLRFGRIERDDWAAPATVGLTPDEGKRLAAAAQAEIVRAQVALMGERFRECEHCRAKLTSKGY